MDFLEFLNKSVTPYHTVECLKQILGPAGGGEYRFERGGAFIAARIPREVSKDSKFRIAMAHTDFPALKITPNPGAVAAGIQTLHPEIYGSPIYTSWLDRDLGYAGLLAYEYGDKVETKLFRSDKLVRIPQLAVHLNRGVNQDGLRVNPQTDLDALWTANVGVSFTKALQREIPKRGRLLDFDVQLFDAQGAQFGGLEDEWIFSGRLDNLSSCHAMAEAFANAPVPEKDFVVAAFFNNEEVGSVTREGAAGNFLKSALDSLSILVSGSLTHTLSSSLALSIDMAHAEHPNFPQKHDPNHAPILGQGVVLKTNSQKRYATDVLSSAQFMLLCERNAIPYQTFVMRNDMPCGSTVGPAVSAALGIPTVDIGEPMLSMHSIREMTAVKDHESMTRLVSAFFC
jgi:aspartyl aminopeptidase